MVIKDRKRKDYYDSVQIYGADPSVVYIRKQEQLNLANTALDRKIRGYGYINWTYESGNYKDINIGKYSIHKINRGYWITTGFAVIVCGQIYKGIKINYGDDDYGDDDCGYYYSTEDMISDLKKRNIDDDTISNMCWNHKLFSWEENRKFSGLHRTPKMILEKYFSIPNPKDFYNIMIEMNIPILLVTGDSRSELTYIKNPLLKTYQFYKVCNAYEIYQNLSMFIGGVLSKPETVSQNITDIDMAVKKGFDKHSFRMDSPGKKTNRRSK
jgi:hypothetical protein